jgi:hypothetical protein
MPEDLPLASGVGKTLVGGIDLKKARMQQVVEALIALSPHPTASRLRCRPPQYGPRHAGYNLKKLRGKQIVRRIGQTRRSEPLPTGLRAMTALIVLRNEPFHPTRGANNPKPIDTHYQAITVAMKGILP